ncbi:MAG: Glu-tRNA(Gln) amidotransferase subunit GatD [Nitrososphaerales archaeon]
MPSPADSEKKQQGSAAEILARFGARLGQRVRLETSDGLFTSGLLIPRYEHADSKHIVLKLRSGYNIGVKVSKIQAISVLKDEPTRSQAVEKPVVTRPAPEDSRKSLLLLSTGGTIASRIDYRTGAVHPALSAMDLYAAIPELDQIANIAPEVVFSVYSENMGPKQWEVLSERIVQRTKEKSPDGIVVMIGTDTLAYASAALSFSLIGHEIPVVLVGAQRSTDRPSSDGALNLKAAAAFAVDSHLAGVYVAMHATENDDFIAIHSGPRVRKNHTSRRNAFESIDVPYVARVKGTEIVFSQTIEQRQGSKPEASFALKTKFDENVALVKFHPGFDHKILEYLSNERKVKGIIIEGSGLGHVNSAAVTSIAEITKKGIFVGITSQCIWGHVDLNVYDSGRDLISAGGVPLENMIPETAFAKLSWALANFDNAGEIMLTNLVGESTPRIPLKVEKESQMV